MKVQEGKDKVRLHIASSTWTPSWAEHIPNTSSAFSPPSTLTSWPTAHTISLKR